MTVLVTPPAPTYPIHAPSLVTIEYPGPVASTSQLKAVDTLGGLQHLTRVLNQDEGKVELNFRPQVTFSHSVAGETLSGRNHVVLKVTKRRRKRKKTKIVGEEVLDDVGVFKVETLGTVNKLIRFRDMADIQYEPKNVEADKTVGLANALRRMDVDALQAFRFPDASEDFEGDLNLLPPPMFSRVQLPQVYQYRQNHVSTRMTTTKADGTEFTRMVNTTKYKGELIQAITWATPTENIPKGPDPKLGAKDSKPGLESSIIDRLLQLFEERPVWNRVGLLNQFSKTERTRISNTKLGLPFTCYTFSDGPFRDSCVRFGYDPRLDPEARLYQRIMIRNMSNAKVYLKKVVGASGPGIGDPREKDSDNVSHIFDGQAVHRNIGNFQLCDITEPYLARAIQNQDWIRETCHERDGWWDGEYFEFLRTVLRRKFFALLQEGRQLPDEAFADLEEHLRGYRALMQAEGYGVGAAPYSSGDQQQGDTSGTGNAPDESFERARKLPSLKHKGKRSGKARAKSVDNYAESLRSRLSQTVEPPSIGAWAAADGSFVPEEGDTIMEEPEGDAEDG